MTRWIGRQMVVMAAAASVFALVATSSHAAEVAPLAVKLPGTQPGEASQIESVSKCDNCHGNFDPAGEPWFNWSGSMMAHASRDPVFWAAVAIAEQDFSGSGDLCVRCHVAEGWLGGRSEPTDGSGLAEGDDDGVQCDVCHRLTNPDASEHVGEQNPPFVANDGGSPATGYYGSGMAVLWDSSAKLGPYADAEARHQAMASEFHRSSDLCGTCHDVSNPVTGDLAHNFGAQKPLPAGSYSGDPNSPVQDKAAFNNPPYAYGVVERTFSEHQSSGYADLPVSDFTTLPAELQQGSLLRAWQAAQLAGNGGNYEDGTLRTFSCQTCHMRGSVGQGCNKNPPVRTDLPVHDLTGGNYWVPDAMVHLDDIGALPLGGGLTEDQRNALVAGKIRAQQNLDDSAALTVSGNSVRVVNLTGHKLISGYPEGRRMWLNVRWTDSGGALLAEDNAYGNLEVEIDGTPTTVETLLELKDPYAPVYEAHGAMTQEWATQLLGLGTPASVPLVFDRVTGSPTATLGDLAAQVPGSHRETFHFVLNNFVAKDNRIPPYGMRNAAAIERNILPVPADRYSIQPDGTYPYWDEVPLNPPPDAAGATVRLLYQPTSWEYVQFLALANTGESAFLADEGASLLDAWLATGMATPYVMNTASWTPTVPACADGLDNDRDGKSDYPEDPGCTSAVDESENEPGLACDDRQDSDGDGQVDATQDVGCLGPESAREDPACDDGIDNDGDGKIDWNGGAAGGTPDPQCIGKPWKNREAARRCGLGVELSAAIGAALLIAVRLRRRPRPRSEG